MCCGSRKLSCLRSDIFGLMPFLSKHGILFQICWASAVPTKFLMFKNCQIYFKNEASYVFVCNSAFISIVIYLSFPETKTLEQSKFNVCIVLSVSDFYHSWTWLFLPVIDILYKSLLLEIQAEFIADYAEYWEHPAGLWVSCPPPEGRRSSWAHRRHSAPVKLFINTEMWFMYK